MKNLKSLNRFLVVVFSLFFSQSFAQKTWHQLIDEGANFNVTKAAFEKQNKSALKSYKRFQKRQSKSIVAKPKEVTAKAEHELEEYQDIIHFKRLADWIEPRVSESKGDIRAMITGDLQARLALQRQLPTRSAANWTILGPINTDLMVGNGRVNSIRVSPSNSNILYACTPAGQLWKSVNSGGSWSVISNGIPAAGVTDLAIDPTNTQILYALTGDADRAIYQPYSIGLYKSTDGGNNWATTGLTYAYSSVTIMTSVVVHPTTPNIVLVSGANGIWRSTDGGTNFTNVHSATPIRELVFKPNAPSVMYAGSKTGGKLLKSTDAGGTWTQLTNGLPTSTDAVRFSVDVSPVNTNYVYALATNTSNTTLGFYQSTDEGATFTQMSGTSPNIAGGQGWYNLCIAADPTDVNTVYAGGVLMYKTTNGGTSWTTLSGDYHVDVHDLTFIGSTLHIASDGGVYSTTNGSTWTDKSTNLAIAQPYSLGLSASNANMIVSGHQDNGTNLTTNGTTWKTIVDADGMISFIDRTNNNNIYASIQNGNLFKSINGGASFEYMLSTAGGYWVTPFQQDPMTANTIYAAGNALYKSTNSGGSFSTIATPVTGIRWFDIARTDNQIIYFTTPTATYKSTDGGANWTDVSSTASTATILHVHIDVNNNNNIYLSRSSYIGNSLYFSNNGGTTWTNIGAGLPNVPVNTVMTQIGVSGAAYCGTDVGVFYRPNSSSNWQAFSAGMPVVPVRDLEISYLTGKIRAATFGRSLWESPLEIVIPVELISFSATKITEGGLLTWKTAQELRFNGFEIERSSDAKTWEKLGEQKAQNKPSDYHFLDKQPFDGINYYRLKMVDNDGTFKYSKVVSVEWLNGFSKNLTLFPNPTKDKLYLKGNENLSNQQVVKIIDLTGKVVLKTKVEILRGGLSFQNLPNGAYFLDINGQKLSFVIQN